MLQVGITGGMGTGKSTVCNIFASIGIPVLNMDALAKQIIQTDADIKTQIQHQFGQDVFSDNILNKKILAERAFANTTTTQLLNNIVHPKVLFAAKQWHLTQQAAYTIQESALCIESGSYKQLDHIIGVTSTLQLRLQRIIARDNCTEAQANTRIQLQMPEQDKLPYYNYIVNNNTDQLLIPQVLAIHHQLIQLIK